jgi:arylsulfatase A-like enzyme/Tfp pilus assembly protein PilF
LLLAACSGTESRLEQSSPGAPVILISIDTLRSDRLPAYGYRGVETPDLDRFRRDAVLFERAYSPTPMTLPSHVTMLSGVQPNRHGVRNNAGFRYDPARFPPVSRILSGRGYATAGAVSSYVLRGESGLRDCFEVYDDSIDPHPGAAFSEYQRSGSATGSIAKSWIAANRTRPFFYFFHIYEPHVPYDPPEPFRSRYASPYDGEIAHADAIVGDLLEHLRRSGVYDRALIIITSDHGEGLGDHGEEQHSVLLYREALQVPLLIKFPGSRRAGEAVAEPVQLADLAPTILDVADVEAPDAFDGVSLAKGSVPADRPIYGESLFPLIHLGWSELRSLIRGRHHFIEGPKPELYDIVADPAERNNLIEGQRRIAASLRAALQSFDKGQMAPSSVDPETARKLAALGYLGAPAAGGAQRTRLNPVDHIGLLNDIRAAFEMAATGRESEAIRSMRSLLERSPDAIDLRLRLAELLASEMRNDEAVREYEEALRRSPVPLPDVSLQAGALCLRMQRIDEAEEHARSALESLPAQAGELLARAAMARGDLAAAAGYADAARGAGGSAAQLVLQAEIAQQRGDSPRTLALLDEAERLAGSRGGNVYRLHFVRADTYAKNDRVEEAIAEYREEIEAFPSNLDAYAGLAVLHFLKGEKTEVDRTIDNMVGSNPTGRAREMAARTYEAFGDAARAAQWRRAP